MRRLVDNADYVLTSINDGITDVTWDDPTDKYFLQLREDALEAGRKFLTPIRDEIFAILQEADLDRAKTVIMDTRKRSTRDAERRIKELEEELNGLRNGIKQHNKEIF